MPRGRTFRLPYYLLSALIISFTVSFACDVWGTIPWGFSASGVALCIMLMVLMIIKDSKDM
jgi:hypothetical protein